MKNMIVTVPYWEHSSTLKIALHIWVSGESEWNILLMAIWHRWNSPGLEAGFVSSSLKVCCFITQWEQRIEEQLLTLPRSRETGTSAEGEVHTQAHLPALVSKSIYCATSTETKSQHFALSPNVFHKLTKEISPSASCSKPDRTDINVLAGKPAPLFEDNRRISALVQF